MPSNIITNTFTDSTAGGLTGSIISAATGLFIILGSTTVILWLFVMAAHVDKNDPKKAFCRFALSFSGMVLCVLVVGLASHERDRQRDALKTTTFKVASVTRETDNGSDKFVYHVENNKFDVKTIASPMGNTDNPTNAVTDEAKVKTITLKYGKLDGTSDGQKNLYKITKKVY